MMSKALDQFKQAAVANTLRRCPLFADMGADDLGVIASMTAHKCVAKDAYLFWEGAPVHGFYVVQTGAIKLHRLNLKGQEQVFHVFRSTESFAEETMLSDSGYPADASATEDSRVLLVQKAPFVRLMKTHRELALRLLKAVSQQVRSLMGLVDDLTLKDVKTRLANWLIHHCPDPQSCQPQRVELEMTMRVLASELGVTSETLSRTLARFRKNHLVRVEGRTVVLTCPTRLATMVDHHAGPSHDAEPAGEWTGDSPNLYPVAEKLAAAH